MTDRRLFTCTGRKIVVTGHYGSGKTEFSISLALKLASQSTEKLAIIDLDIVNPYFRSREQRALLENSGISVYGSTYDTEITAELPAIGATIKTPLEDKNCRVIVDVGGNDSGARALNQFIKYFSDGETSILVVINACRPETTTIKGALEHINAIESTTNLTITGIVNNSHMLRETTAAEIIFGHDLCEKICEETNKQLWLNCYPAGIVDPEELAGLSGELVPLGHYMRPAWLDK